MLIESDVQTIVFYRVGHHAIFIRIYLDKTCKCLSFSIFKKIGTKIHSLVKSKFSSFNCQDDHQMAKTELCLRDTRLNCYLNGLKHVIPWCSGRRS